MNSIVRVGLMNLALLSACSSNTAIPAVTVDEPEPLHGTVVLRDERDASHVPVEGTMQVYLSPWEGDDEPVEVRIHDGKWTCSRPCEASGYAIGRMLLDGHDAYSQESVFMYQGERFVALEAERLEPAYVHVVDQRTRADISSVKLREAWTDSDRVVEPGVVLATGDGRFAIDPWCTWAFPGAYKDGGELWVEAAGYEPHVQFINPWQGGEWLVELSACP